MAEQSLTDPQWPAVAMLVAGDGFGHPLPEEPLPALSERLAQLLVDDYGDSVLLVTVSVGPGEPSLRPGNPARLQLPVPSDTNAANRLICQQLNQYASRYAYSFLAVEREQPSEFAMQLADFLGDWDCGLDPTLYLRLVELQTRESARPRHDRWSVLACALIRPRPQPEWLGLKDPRDWLLVRKHWLSQQKTGHDIDVGPGSRHPAWHTGCQDPEQVRAEVGPDGRVSRGGLARCARALSHRRIGLALGGAGAWGYAHIALLRALEKQGVPVDIICGSSSGALVGAYYAAFGDRGLQLLLDRGWPMTVLACCAIVSMTPLEMMISRDTDAAMLSDLELMYFPITTNLTRMQAERVVNASVAWGVRASATAPGLFGPTKDKDAVFVDGAVGGNVPTPLVAWLGADLVVAMNALPRPLGLDPSIRQAGPIARLREFRKSLGAVFHDMGDWSSRGHITYDPPQQAYPLVRTLMFFRGRALCESTEGQPEFDNVLEAVTAQWSKLSASRQGAPVEVTESRAHVRAPQRLRPPAGMVSVGEAVSVSAPRQDGMPGSPQVPSSAPTEPTGETKA
ncbi:MAG: patatin-like phospholipase family protein [Myxococcales bacterium]|nr:patatin-like phospholipase family protein [Myxococcales bacterium]